MTLVTTDLTAQEYGQRVRGHLARAVEGTVAAGRELIEAKERVAHGQFGDVVEAAGISDATARRLMAIANNPALSNRTHAYVLPGSWTTLYELSRMEPQAIEQGIAEGAIRPDTTRDDVHALRTRLEELDRETRDARRRFTERLDTALSSLPSLIEHADIVHTEWLRDEATYVHLPHQGYWFTPEGLRETARRLDKLADSCEEDPL